MSKYIDNISKQTAAGFSDDEFYLVTEKVDFLMQLWAGEQMGDDGVYELMSLCNLIYSCKGMWYEMPKEAKDFFRVLINPKNKYKMSTGKGGQYRNYAQLRQYLIDNQEAISKVMRKLDGIEDHQELWDIKFVKDGGTTEIVDTYASEEACQQELAYYRSKPGIGVRYFMEKKNDQ